MMKDERKTKKQLIEELVDLRKKGVEYGKAEEALKASEKRYQDLYDNAPDMFGSIDAETSKIIQCNNTLARVLGYTKDELIGQLVFFIYHPDCLEDAEKAFQQFMATGEIHDVELQLKGKDGRVIDVMLNASAVRDGQGRIISSISILRDITEPKRVDQTIEMYRRQNELILTAAGEGIYGLDLDGNTTFVNPAAANFIGWDPQDLIGRSQHKVLHHSKPDGSPYDPEECPIYAAFKDGKQHHVDDEVFWRKDGSSFPVEYISTPIRNDQDEIEGAVVTFKDITMRKQAEVALLESEERFRRAITDAPAPIMIHAEDEEVLQINNVWTELTGFTHSDIPTIGDWAIKAYGQKMDDIRSVIDAVFERNAIAHDGEFTIRTKSGETRVWDFSSGPIGQLSDGRRLVISMGTDVTERVQAEQALRESEERFRALASLAPVGVYLTDPNGSVHFVNERWIEMTGLRLEEALEDGWKKAVHPEDRQLFNDAWKKMIEAKGRWGQEYRLQTQNGDITWVLGLATTQLDENGEIVGYIGVNLDITNRVQAEEALKEYSERLEEMVKERTRELEDAQEQLIRNERLIVLGELAGGVGHELRNPLAVISNSVYYLQMVQQDPDADVKEYLEIIAEGVQNAEKIVSSLLDFGRSLSSDKQKTSIPVMVAKVLENNPAPENVKVTTKIITHIPTVLVDPLQIRQVLDNLLTNAYQAMPEGGKITIDAEEIQDRIHISIKDSGIGISDEIKNKIFEPLFTTKARGIGLGLALSKRLIEANDGDIKVESTTGLGSTFTLILPTLQD